jgi:hypothetical protein
MTVRGGGLLLALKLAICTAKHQIRISLLNMAVNGDGRTIMEATLAVYHQPESMVTC